MNNDNNITTAYNTIACAIEQHHGVDIHQSWYFENDIESIASSLDARLASAILPYVIRAHSDGLAIASFPKRLERDFTENLTCESPQKKDLTNSIRTLFELYRVLVTPNLCAAYAEEMMMKSLRRVEPAVARLFLQAQKIPQAQVDKTYPLTTALVPTLEQVKISLRGHPAIRGESAIIIDFATGRQRPSQPS